MAWCLHQGNFFRIMGTGFHDLSTDGVTQMPCQCLVRLENKTLLAFTTFQLCLLAHVADLHAAPLPLRRKLVLFLCRKRVWCEDTLSEISPGGTNFLPAACSKRFPLRTTRTIHLVDAEHKKTNASSPRPDPDAFFFSELMPPLCPLASVLIPVCFHGEKSKFIKA